MIHRKLVASLNSARFFHHLQFGFRADRCTYDAINILLSTIKKVCGTHTKRTTGRSVKSSVSLNNYCPVVFLDLKKAFDRVWHDYLLDTLRQATITGRAWKWIAAFLSNRLIRTVDSNEASRWFPIQYGVPQGSVLSPLLFIIFINPIAQQISASYPLVEPLLYADDKALKPVRRLGRPLLPAEYRTQLKGSLQLLTHWCSCTGMVFNAKKTKLVVFTGAKRPNFTYWRSLTLCGFTIERVTSYQYLGLWLHFRLSWKEHMDHILRRTRLDSHRLVAIARAGVGGKIPPPSFGAIRSLCLGYLRPRFTYGIAFWGHQCDGVELRKFQSLQIRPLLASLKMPVTTQQLGMHVEFNIPSIAATYRYALLSFYLRAKRLPTTHPTRAQLALDLIVRAGRRDPLKPLYAVPTLLLASHQVAPHYINTVVPYAKAQFCAQHKRVPRFLTALRSVDDLNKAVIHRLQMWDTHHEWTTDTAHPSTAPLLQEHCKPAPFRSTFLFQESLSLATLRVKLRADRARTQARIHKMALQAQKHQPVVVAGAPAVHLPSPLCTFPACNPPAPAGPAPPAAPTMDSVHHILLDCPRHSSERHALTQDLAQMGFTLPLTVAFLTGTVSTAFAPNKARTAAKLALTATFLFSIVKKRALDPLLSPFISHDDDP
jgi:hypothetical protein